MAVVKSYKISSVFSSTELKNEVYNLTVENKNLKTNIEEFKEGTITYLDLSSTNIVDIRQYAYRNYENLIEVRLPYGSNFNGQIGGWSFQGCTNLREIYGQLTWIDQYAFSGCTSLEHIQVSGYGTDRNLKSIEKYGLENCVSLKSLDLSQGSYMMIGDYAFKGCTGLTSLILPKTTSIYKYAFDGCSSLTSITYRGTKAEWNARYKDTTWKDNSAITTVKCSDGNISV